MWSFKVCVWILFVAVFACRCAVVPETFVENTIFAQLYCFCNFFQDQLVIFMWFYFWTLIMFYWYVCLFFHKYQTILFTITLYNSKSWRWVSLVLWSCSFLSILSWLFWGFCLSNLRISLLISTNNFLGFCLGFHWIILH